MTLAGGGGAVKGHVLIIPFPTSGHVIPLLDLTRLLAMRGLTVTVLATPQILPLLSAYPSSVNALVLQLLPPEAARDVALASVYPRAAIQALGSLHGPLREWIAAQPNPPSVIISDMFVGWAHRLAEEVGIRRVLFSPSGAMALSVVFTLWRDMPKIADSVSFPEIPNSPTYPWRQLSGLFQAHREGEPVSEFIREGFLANMESWGVVVNTFNELEGPYMDHLRKIMGHDRVWATGPLLPPEADSFSRGGSSSVLADDMVSWLDSRKDGSVVYVCFGSQVRLAEEQMTALALGMEKSGANFVWVVRADGPMKVLEGFEDRVAGRGFVIKGWAPQLPILNHRAMGAFLTHCGWNSILEGIKAGVPMLAWPMGADQFVNATLIVDQLKVARRVSEGAGTVPDSDKLAEAITELIGEDRPERSQATEIKGAAVEAIDEGGCSYKDLDEFVKCIHASPLDSDIKS
ncbi:hypothetical protein CDL15_Pgr014646 [Punica granatum]|uniref:Glycosyltransferase n=1 Tax=Punica granatum TaxID=22663 RepID=A0A218XZG0_PUNGR|nr:hypothetical protein CDL15_Pgr014646 [Punica granatum]PKI70340.1 hypothetical protein CRG98_009220 [Punica granatum]